MTSAAARRTRPGSDGQEFPDGRQTTDAVHPGHAVLLELTHAVVAIDRSSVDAEKVWSGTGVVVRKVHHPAKERASPR